MQKNEGTIDRIIRVALAVILGVLYYAGAVSGTIGAVILVLAIILLITGVMGWCGIYALFGISTIKKPASDSDKIGPAPGSPVV
jgi:hypothetical protein